MSTKTDTEKTYTKTLDINVTLLTGVRELFIALQGMMKTFTWKVDIENADLNALQSDVRRAVEAIRTYRDLVAVGNEIVKVGLEIAPKQMTPAEFLAKFPNDPQHAEPKNEDSLILDMACPKCGQRDRFDIAVSQMMEVYDDETDSCGDTEWDEHSYCRCGKCDNGGEVKDFTIEGLDDAIAEQEEE
jgi:hypothetical protein